VNNHVIYKLSLNESGVTHIVLDGNDPGIEERGVKTIALDRRNRKIYFFGRNLEFSDKPYYLAYVDYNGSDKIIKIDLSESNEIYSMDIYGETLYFANYMSKGYNRTSCPDSIMSIPTNISHPPRLETLFVPAHCLNVSITCIVIN
jgi:hypothetical protein